MLLDNFIMNSRAMLENNMAFYSRKTDGGRKLRAKALTRKFTGISRNERGQAVTEWQVPSASDPGKVYDCYISVEPKQGTLFTLASGKGNLKTRMELIKDADVRCFCTCPDFNWSGAKYNMKHRYDGYETGHNSVDGVPDGSDIRPNVRDPKGRNTLCKHLMTCFTGMLTSAQVIMKAARTAKFPKDYTKEPEDIKITDGDKAPKENYGKDNSELNMFKPDKGEEPTGGEMKMVGAGDKKPLADYPKGEEEVLKVLGEAAPVKIPEAQEALDALAGTLGEPEPNDVTGGEITALGNGEEPTVDNDKSELTMLGNEGSPDLSDPLTGLEDAANLKMFNPDDDENT